MNMRKPQLSIQHLEVCALTFTDLCCDVSPPFTRGVCCVRGALGSLWLTCNQCLIILISDYILTTSEDSTGHLQFMK